MFRPSGPQQTSELHMLAKYSHLVELHDSGGNIMTPCCPYCGDYLTPIINAHKFNSFVEIRKVAPTLNKMTTYDEQLFEACEKHLIREVQKLIEQDKDSTLNLKPLLALRIL